MFVLTCLFVEYLSTAEFNEQQKTKMNEEIAKWNSAEKSNCSKIKLNRTSFIPSLAASGVGSISGLYFSSDFDL